MAFLLATVSFFTIFYNGIDDKASFNLYLRKLRNLSEYTLDSTQKYLVIHYYGQNYNKHPNKIRRNRVRAEFNTHKRQLQSKWSAHYAKPWPSKKHFHMHHIVPINAGGPNAWWNVTPLSEDNHRELHASLEEHAAFSHNAMEKKSCRLLLKIREKIREFLEKTIDSPKRVVLPAAK
jgi:5-methylcytosine-specific restriction endonuclease McrA